MERTAGFLLYSRPALGAVQRHGYIVELIVDEIWPARQGNLGFRRRPFQRRMSADEQTARPPAWQSGPLCIEPLRRLPNRTIPSLGVGCPT
jgi:hypothetical protein